MGTEVLRPQDCLVERIRFAPPRKNHGNFNYNFNHRPNRKPAVRSERKHFRLGSGSGSSQASSSSENFAMEKVTILRRGESLDLKKMKSSEGEGFVVTGTDRLGPDPEMVPKQTRIVDLRSPVKSDVYAGSAFSVSPAPSSLPLPSFSKKKQISFDDSATRDLRRLLRLDL